MDTLLSPPPTSTTTITPIPTTTTTNVGPRSSDRTRAEFLAAGVAYNAPAQARLNEEVIIQLLLALDVRGEALTPSVTGPGKKESADIQATCATTAQLRGRSFEVLELTPSEQYVCAGTRAEWRWEVTPLEGGLHTLTMTLTAAIDDDPPVTIQVYATDIQVEVSLVDRFVNPITERLGVSLTAFLTALAAAAGTWSWNRMRRKHDHARESQLEDGS